MWGGLLGRVWGGWEGGERGKERKENLSMRDWIVEISMVSSSEAVVIVLATCWKKAILSTEFISLSLLTTCIFEYEEVYIYLSRRHVCTNSKAH